MTSVSTRRVKALPIIIWGYIIWSLVPVLIAVIYSCGKAFRSAGGLATNMLRCFTTLQCVTQL
jgi:hypothetical protein